MAEGAHITVIEDSANDSTDFLEHAAEDTRGELRATSVADMVTKVLAELGDDGCLQMLDLVGHGRGGNISVGDGDGSEPGKHIDGNRREWEPHLERLKGRFCEGGKLRLLGCNTGVCQAGARKLQELADFLDVEVFGTKRTIYGYRDFGPDGFEGDEDDLVSVSPGDNVTACLAASPTEGLRRADDEGLDLRIDRYVAFGVRDVRRFGLPGALEAQLFPFRAEALLVHLLELFDLETLYDAHGLAADLDALVHLLTYDQGVETWGVTLDHHALLLPGATRTRLVVARDGDGAADFLGRLTKAQGAHEAVFESVGPRVPREPTGGATHVLIERVRAELGPEYRDMPAAELLDQKPTALEGVSKERAHALEEAGLRSIGDLLRLEGDPRLRRIARDIREVARRDARRQEGSEPSV